MTKQELTVLLAAEKRLYLGENKRKRRQMKYACHKRYCIWRALRDFRLAQYYNGLRTDPDAGRFKKDIARLLFRYRDRCRNRSGAFAGIEIGLGSRIGQCPDIWHGNIVINGALGDNCILHGANVIGNKGKSGHGQTPVIGNGVDIGAGAILIGDIRIADGCVIGAGAVVTRSCDVPGSVLVGVPAHRIDSEQKGR